MTLLLTLNPAREEIVEGVWIVNPRIADKAAIIYIYTYTYTQVCLTETAVGRVVCDTFIDLIKSLDSKTYFLNIHLF